MVNNMSTNEKHMFRRVSVEETKEFAAWCALDKTVEGRATKGLLLNAAEKGMLLSPVELFHGLGDELFILTDTYVISVADCCLYKLGAKDLSKCNIIPIDKVYIQQ